MLLRLLGNSDWIHYRDKRNWTDMLFSINYSKDKSCRQEHDGRREGCQQCSENGTTGEFSNRPKSLGVVLSAFYRLTFLVALILVLLHILGLI